MIIRPKNKIYPPILYFPRWIEKGLKLKSTFHNEFHACLYDKEQYMKFGEKAPKIQEAWAYNVFCNQGLAKIIEPTQFVEVPHRFMLYCGIGTGAGTPAITDTTFFTYLSSADIATEEDVSNPDTNSINHETEEYYHRHKFFWDLEEGNGDLTEVGLSNNTDYTISHAMFQDAEGTPITITKDNTKVLVITVTVYLERETSDSGAMILNDGIDGLIGLNLTIYGMGLNDDTYRYGYIYLGNTDQAVNRTDCYGTSYPVLGSTRSNKKIISTTNTGSGYGKTCYADWGLNEANGTWYEVGLRSQFGNIDEKNIARWDLPSGAIGENTLVKDDTKKLRVTLELYFTQ